MTGILLQALDSVKDSVPAATSALAGKGGAWYDVPVAWAVLGVLAHLYAKWGDKRRYVKVSFWAYLSLPQRVKMHVLTFAMIGAWTANIGIAGYNFRDAIPYHWVVGLLFGYFTDSLLKLAIKQVPALGTLIGAKRNSEGDLTISPTQQMPAIPPPPGFDKEPST